MPRPDRPWIGISVNSESNAKGESRYDLAPAYASAVTEAGGLPLLLPHEPALAEHYLDLCDGLILTGGDDPVTEAFGEPTHPRARPIAPRRQAFELALLDAAAARPELPVLGICLGMQLMALHGGGRLDQFLPETLGSAATVHQDNRRHPIVMEVPDSVLWKTRHAAHPRKGSPLNGPEGNGDFQVISHHRQAVVEAGVLRVVARAADGVIEAIDAPVSQRRFYLGVQWHPERRAGEASPDDPLSLGLFAALSAASRECR